MTYDAEILRKLQNFYNSKALEFLLAWEGKIFRLGVPKKGDRCVGCLGQIWIPGNYYEPDHFDPEDAVIILRPEHRKAKVKQSVFTPLTDNARRLRKGEYYYLGGEMCISDGEYPSSRTIPFTRTFVEVEIEVEDDDVA